MFAKAVSRFLLPNLERDLTKAVSKELATASKMSDCFLAPTVYGYESRAVSSTGIGHATSSVHQRTVVEKVHYKVPAQGLFQ